MNKYKFTEDWFTENIPVWNTLFSFLKNQEELNILEIGSFEGRSTVWFLENLLSGKNSNIICIDPEVKPNFFHNISMFKEKVKLIKNKSQFELRKTQYLKETFDIIYIDGDHTALSVLEDAILAFRALKKHGFLIFDDYLWKKTGVDTKEPMIAIDSFLKVYAERVFVIHKEYQVIINKITH